MKTASSVLALVSVLIACFTFIFVWAGTESVHFEWVAMDDDLTIAQLETALRPPQAEDYENTASMPAAALPEGVNFVLWINISGFRADYISQAETPFFDSLVQQGSHTSELNPAFPTLRYPSLISQATGRLVKDHGVAADKLRHPESGEIVLHPTSLDLLHAEPIWTTAKRQGIPVLVHHWPFSQEQPSEHPADIYLPEIDLTSGAEQRLNALLEAWSGHQGESKIRLAMTSLHDLDAAARSYGTREKETYEAVASLDKTLATFRDQLREKWPAIRTSEADQLHLLITTDHGMADARRIINFGALMGNLAEQIDYASSGAIARVWFKNPPEDPRERQRFETAYDSELKARIYWRTYTRAELPESWHLGTGPQTGDRFLMLKSGYSFTDETGSEPVFDPSEVSGPFADSGYPVAEQSRMLGQAFFATLNGDSRGTDLGPVEGVQLHATVCQLLEIKPADGVEAKPIRLE